MRRCVLLALLLLPSALLHAQEQPPGVSATTQAVVLSSLGSGAGLIVGAAVGAGLENCGGSNDDWCGLGGALLGGLVGSVSGAAIGAYAGSNTRDGRAPVGAAVVGSVIGVGVGWLTAVAVARTEVSFPVVVGAFTVGQGTFAGLYTSLFRRPVPPPDSAPR